MTVIGARRAEAAAASLRELDGRTVAWFRLAGGKRGGAIGPGEAEVLQRGVDLAVEFGVPIVGEISSSGADVTQGVASLHGWGLVAAAVGRASGVVPIVLAVTGPAVSGPALLLGLADHVIVTPDAFAYVTGPQAVADFTGIVLDRHVLGTVGLRDLASLVVDEEHVLEAAADILSHLPSNYRAAPPVHHVDDPADRPSTRAADAVPANANASYDVRVVLEDVLDDGSFLEVRAAAAPNIVTAYGRLAGHAVGIIANQANFLAGTIDIPASQKGAGFVQSCDAFGLPLVTFVDTPGFLPGKDLEWRGMIRHGAELVFAYGAATVPRIAVILRKAYGGAYIVMDSRGLGNDVCVAWPRAEIAVMGAAGAVEILHRRRDPELEAEYQATYCTPTIAAERGYVDEIIDPADTRRVLCDALERLSTKRAGTDARPHTNTPL